MWVGTAMGGARGRRESGWGRSIAAESASRESGVHLGFHGRSDDLATPGMPCHPICPV
jgi:hypothetical protein